jgi:hypothetical protein
VAITRHQRENRWGVLVLLALGLMISHVDRTSMSAAFADQHLVHEFSLTHVQRGWLGFAMFLVAWPAPDADGLARRPLRREVVICFLL